MVNGEVLQHLGLASPCLLELDIRCAVDDGPIRILRPQEFGDEHLREEREVRKELASFNNIGSDEFLTLIQ